MVTESDGTIAAIATPSGEGGIGIVRLSGPEAIAIASQLFQSSRGLDITVSRRRVFHGHIADTSGKVIDEVLVHCMRAPHSYTCEDVVEINAHGGPGPVHAVLEAVLAQGARLAGPGEFTRRAFLNGRIDLVQAEAVIDTIRARTQAGLQAAQSASSGVLSRAIHALRESLGEALARIEAGVDFPEEDLPELLDAALVEAMRDTHRQMLALLATADAGRLYREGAAIAIAGRPNAGKSSLFNALLRDKRAIVTEHAGTTRDRLEETMSLQGVPVRLIDTAGLRTTDDAVERIGVAVARDALRAANLVIHLIDAADIADEDRALAEEIAALDTPVVRVLNKIDLAPGAAMPADYPAATAVARISATTAEGLADLEDQLATLLLGGVQIDAGAVMLNRMHQKDSLRRAAESVARVLADTSVSPEFLAFELREALQAVGEITGETTPDDILETIFGAFCIGK